MPLGISDCLRRQERHKRRYPGGFRDTGLRSPAAARRLERAQKSRSRPEAFLFDTVGGLSEQH
jgi:hypothetical protein